MAKELFFVAITLGAPLAIAACTENAGDAVPVPHHVQSDNIEPGVAKSPPVCKAVGRDDAVPEGDERKSSGDGEPGDDETGVGNDDDTRGGFNVPTGGPPSPLFGAGSFTQQMILFEEFGTLPFDPSEPPPALSFPHPVDDRNGPVPDELEAFLAQKGMSPYAARLAAGEGAFRNPWEAHIELFLGRPLDTPPADGRPPGEGWAHQRWREFPPQRYFVTAQAGSRANGGLRDARQRHGYSQGEFGPGGLYHTVYRSSVSGAPKVVATTRGIDIRFHPKMPVQDKNTVWTFDGTLPPKLLQVRNGEPVLMRHYNALPIDKAANGGFGAHTITTHEHNGHQPGESDGFPGAFFFPGQFYDYRWPLQLAGYDLVNNDASDPRAAYPCSAGDTLLVDGDGDGLPTRKECSKGRIQIRGDWRETMSTHWFHDHMFDHTAENVYKGNAAMMNYYSALDRGNEAVDDGVNLRLPSGTALPWGNRDYDINLLISDKAWDRKGQLAFSRADRDGFLGDRMLANLLYHPWLEVRARSYRFRIINAGVSRVLALALVRKVDGPWAEIAGPPDSGVSYERVPLHLVAMDGNIMEHAVPFDGSMALDGRGKPDRFKGEIPSQSIAERFDIVVDFSKHGIEPDDRLYLVNTMEHKTGRASHRRIPLRDILSGRYEARERDDDGDGMPDRWVDGDPGVGAFLELRVREYAGADLSMDPRGFEPGKRKMIPLPIQRDDPADKARIAAARHHTFEFVRSKGGGDMPWRVKTDGGAALTADLRRIDALVNGALEVWSLKGNGGWSHPVHMHFEEAVILSRGSVPLNEWDKWARKDMFLLGPEKDGSHDIEVAVHGRDFAGTYVQHCHNTTHEDHAMLIRFDAVRDQLELIPTPKPTWDGVEFEDSFALPDACEGDGVGEEHH